MAADRSRSDPARQQQESVSTALAGSGADLRAYLAEGRLRDGAPVWIRALRPEDRVAMQAGFGRLSEATIYHRFFQAKRHLTETELRYLTELDFRDHVALVAEITGPDGEHEGVGVGRFVRVAHAGAEGHAEVAFTVLDPHQGRGVGTLLLDHLARIARGLGYRVFEAEVMPDNRQMLEVFEHSGLPMREVVREGVVHVELGL